MDILDAVFVFKMHILFLLTLAFRLTVSFANRHPQFRSFDSTILVYENAKVGSSLVQFTVWDPEADKVTVTLQGQTANAVFHIMMHPPETGVSANLQKGELLLKSPLDREIISQYSLIVTATDGINTINKYPNVYVGDVNDNYPLFQGLPYQVTISEDAPPGTTVRTVAAIDKDEGIYGTITYRFAKGDERFYDVFAISKLSGAVVLYESLDYETQHSHLIEILAVDGGGLRTSTYLHVNVKDVDELPPVFSSNTYRILLKEEDNSIVNASFKGEPPILATDGDSGINAQLTYEIVNGSTIDNVTYFHINSTTGHIIPTRTLDRENIDFYNLTIKAFQTNRPNDRVTYSTVLIVVDDVNDHYPVLEQMLYNISIKENTPESIEVLVIKAFDGDLGSNAKLQFSLNDSSGAFKIDEETGRIVVKNSNVLDYETVKNLTLIVQAKENQSAELFESEEAVILVNIIDQDETEDNWYYVVIVVTASLLGTALFVVALTIVCAVITTKNKEKNKIHPINEVQTAPATDPEAPTVTDPSSQTPVQT
ncbi:unnamed protein product [Owenia fusiformis]|uniref:Uncharacterized protein n=1 Tax=Owenia fusiformis TaxID=6347 RepID=A0A8J1TZ47_OWEFU|nr:unnamed protein product [Owenia fusiformis]